MSSEVSKARGITEDNWGQFLIALFYQTILFCIISIIGISYVFWTKVPQQLVYLAFPTASQNGYTGSILGKEFYCPPKCKAGRDKYQIEQLNRALIADDFFINKAAEYDANAELMGPDANKHNLELKTEDVNKAVERRSRAASAAAQLQSNTATEGQASAGPAGPASGGSSSGSYKPAYRQFNDKPSDDNLPWYKKIADKTIGRDAAYDLARGVLPDKYNSKESRIKAAAERGESLDILKEKCEYQAELTEEGLTDRNSVYTGDGLEMFPYNFNDGNYTHLGTWFAEIIAYQMQFFRKMVRFGLGWSTRKIIDPGDVMNAGNTQASEKKEDIYFLENSFERLPPTLVFFLCILIYFVIICIPVLNTFGIIWPIIFSCYNAGLLWGPLYGIFIATWLFPMLATPLSGYQYFELAYWLLIYPWYIRKDQLDRAAANSVILNKIIANNGEPLPPAQKDKIYNDTTFFWTIPNLLLCNFRTLAFIYLIFLMSACGQTLTKETTLGVCLGYVGLQILTFFFPNFLFSGSRPEGVNPVSKKTRRSYAPYRPDVSIGGSSNKTREKYAQMK